MVSAVFSQLNLSHSFHLYPVLALGALAIALAVERFVSLFFILPVSDSKNFMNKMRTLVRSNQIEEAIALCDRNRKHPLAAVVGAGLSRIAQGESSVRHAIELSLSEGYQRISARTPYLGTMANVSTLLGLCGTVVGLIQSFASVGELSAQQRGAAMATGISTAMNSTLCGLGIAIGCMIAYSLLMNRVSKLNGELERSALVTLDLVVESYLSEDVSRAA